MEAVPIKAASLPLDFSLNVKTEGISNLNIHVKTSEHNTNMLISPDKSMQSAFTVVTPKHADGNYITPIIFLIFLQSRGKNRFNSLLNKKIT